MAIRIVAIAVDDLTRFGQRRLLVDLVVGTVQVVDDSGKKVEPFYFDARRGASASSIDVGL